MALTNTKNMSQPDILSELNSFIIGATQTSKSNPVNLSKNALFLLKNLPAARDAVLEYFCNVFNIAASNYIKRYETEIATGEIPDTTSKEEMMVVEIHNVLCSFVSQNPQAWAPVISTWSLELLGELSTQYAGRAHVSVSSGLNEVLQLWMGCRSTRTLIEITTQCLTNLMNSDSELWMNALLNTSVKHSPNFDWVVAHVGSCFPNTVITRVLSCGLKDFCQHKSVETGSKSPKLMSVVGILSHLAGSHFGDIRAAILELFSWSVRPYDLTDVEVRAQKISTVPFLLQLATLSPTLLRAMSTDIQNTLRGNIIFQLYNCVNDWCKYFASSKNLQEIIVTLILDTEKDGIQIIKLLLGYIFLTAIDLRPNQALLDIKSTSHEILEHVLQEMDSMVRTDKPPNIVHTFDKDLPHLFDLLLQPEPLIYEVATRITLTVARINLQTLIKATSFLLQNAKSFEHLAMCVRLLSYQAISAKGDQSCASTIFKSVLKQVLLEILYGEDQPGISYDQFWFNLLTILKWEQSKKVPLFRNEISSYSIHKNLDGIVLVLGNPRFGYITSHVIIEILYLTFMNSTKAFELSPSLIFNLTNSVVNYFFLCCTEKDLTLKLKGIKLTNAIFERLSETSKASRIISLRELIERSLFKKENLLFGADISLQRTCGEKRDESLLVMNHQRSTTMMLVQKSHSSIFHAGIIGNRNVKIQPKGECTQLEIEDNVANLIRAILACSLGQSERFGDPLKVTTVSLEALSIVSLLLVHFVSPDVMYNGLPWPEEEFSKVTIERDLHIRRLFTKLPVLWHLTNFIASYRPVLCYCSVLLRALTATLLHQWNSTGCRSNTPDTPNYQTLLEITIKLLDLMSLGQLLPPPLSNMRNVIDSLKPHEIVQLLRECLWNYIRDHVPSPALFSCDSIGLHWRDPTTARPPPLYSDSLRIIIQANIDKIGDQYAQLFLPNLG